MNVYHAENEEDVAEAITRTLEKETGKRIFTMRIINDTEEGLETLVVFQDKSMIHGMVTVMEIHGQLACRIKADYI